MDDPIAALRRQFIESVTGMDYCQAGAHVVQFGYEYEGITHCFEHPAPVGPADPATTGRCQWGVGHWATSIWQVPLDGHWYCADHLRRILAIGWWKP